MKNRLRNFWYYHKIHTIIILAVLAAALYMLSQRDPIKNDYDIAVVSPNGCSDEQLARLRSVLEGAGKDQNGDGILRVNIRVFRFSPGEDGQDPQEIAGLDADLAGNVSGIFFVGDPERFEEVTNGIGKASEAFPVSSLPQFSGCGIDDLYMLVRTGADERYSVMRSAFE